MALKEVCVLLFWSAGETVHGEASNWKHCAAKPPKVVARGSCGCQALEKLHVKLERLLALDEPGAGKAICAVRPTVGRPQHCRGLPSKPTKTEAQSLFFSIIVCSGY